MLRTETRVGLIVNPIAGLGGKVGLRGTDGAQAVAEALRRGAIPIAPERARRALTRLAAVSPKIGIVTGDGELGERTAAGLGLRPEVLLIVGERASTVADDTKSAASGMLAAGVDLILFAGGDGTARDVFAATGTAVPILGIPTGVKMHSAVFATTPENAGEVAGRYVAGAAREACLRDAEIMDRDDEQDGGGRILNKALRLRAGALRAAANPARKGARSAG